MLLLASAGVVACVLFCCALAGPIGAWLGVLDQPDGTRKTHAVPVPLVGGLALMPPVAAYALLQASVADGPAPALVAVAVGGLGATLLGFLDDRYGLRVFDRLVASSALVATAVAIEPKFLLTSLDFGLGQPIDLYLLSLPFTILCVVGLQNAVNMVDGQDGLVISLAMAWTLCMLLYSPSSIDGYLWTLFLGLLIILIYNCRGMLFLGDSGSYALGIVFGLLAIYIYRDAGGQLPMLTVALWFLIPIVDCLRLIVERTASGRAPWAPDRQHFHHRLAASWPWPGCVLIYVGIAAVPALLASIWPSATLPLLAAVVALYGYQVRTSSPSPMRPRVVARHE